MPGVITTGGAQPFQKDNIDILEKECDELLKKRKDLGRFLKIDSEKRVLSSLKKKQSIVESETEKNGQILIEKAKREAIQIIWVAQEKAVKLGVDSTSRMNRVENEDRRIKERMNNLLTREGTVQRAEEIIEKAGNCLEKRLDNIRKKFSDMSKLIAEI